MKDVRNFIAKNIAYMLNDGDFVNLGIGIPTLVANHIPDGIEVILHGENGFAGQGKVIDVPGLHKDQETFQAWLNEHGGEQTNHKTLPSLTIIQTKHNNTHWRGIIKPEEMGVCQLHTVCHLTAQKEE